MCIIFLQTVTYLKKGEEEYIYKQTCIYILQKVFKINIIRRKGIQKIKRFYEYQYFP